MTAFDEAEDDAAEEALEAVDEETAVVAFAADEEDAVLSEPLEEADEVLADAEADELVEAESLEEDDVAGAAVVVDFCCDVVAVDVGGTVCAAEAAEEEAGC